MTMNHILKLLPLKVDYTSIIKEINQANRALGSLIHHLKI